jgi:tRNA (cmo5U34)-methyltransferase
MSDNSTPFLASEYDNQIHKSMPFYEEFHNSAIDLIKTVNPYPINWLDTGCGTGEFVKKASLTFTNTIFFLSDPSKKMIDIAKNVSTNVFEKNTSELDFSENFFDVVTAILSHHYMSKDERRLSTENCFRMLKTSGVYVTFENIRPLSSESTDISMTRWFNAKLLNGESPENRDEHYNRFDKEYLPITISEHIDLLNNIGFKTADVLWLSYMQAGFFAIK